MPPKGIVLTFRLSRRDSAVKYTARHTGTINACSDPKLAAMGTIHIRAKGFMYSFFARDAIAAAKQRSTPVTSRISEGSMIQGRKRETGST